MRWAVKKKGAVVRACRLGDATALEAQLIQDGLLRRGPDGAYEVMSREANDGRGERAIAGDYVKLDTGGRPYPNLRSFFEAHHVKRGDDLYEQIPAPVGVWELADEPCEEIEYLLSRQLLRIDPEKREKTFSAWLFNAPLTAPSDALILFYTVERDADGTILDITFNFITREEFDRTYCLCNEGAAHQQGEQE